MSGEQQAALERLMEIAWGCDSAIVSDMTRVFAYIGHNRHYPDTLGYGRQFAAIVHEWRPELVQS